MIRLAAATFGLALLSVSAVAETLSDFDAHPPGLPNKSWTDLLRQVFPDIKTNTKGDVAVRGDTELRPIDKAAFGGECPDELVLTGLEFARLRISDKERLIVGVGTESDVCFAPLALFDASAEGKLIDAADVKQDKNYGFGADFVRRLGPDGALVVVTNFHINAGEGYDIESLILVTAERLTPIGDLFAKSELTCRQSIEESATVTVAPDYGPMARITGYVKTSTQRLAADCSIQQGSPKVSITHTDWRWNAARRAYTKVSR